MTMNARGYAAIALVNPKCPANIGGVLRAAGCYDASLVVIAGERGARSIGRLSTDTQKAYKHIPTLVTSNVFDAIPFDCVPVAVDLVPSARSLVNFCHPERSFYIFGAEDGTLGKEIYSRCKFSIQIPTTYCMNLAATVNVVLYDRMAKGYVKE